MGQPSPTRNNPDGLAPRRNARIEEWAHTAETRTRPLAEQRAFIEATLAQGKPRGYEYTFTARSTRTVAGDLLST